MATPNLTAHNRLAAAASPYLRMHAGNPVHWQPWDAAALAYARATDTPILLSIGYSACHWCHVMAHECFEDAAIATAMNRAFVNIKLDREERPDIDRSYQLAHQALRGRGGGWPLTVFLDPQDLAPFYIGTYFPPVPRHGLPGFLEVLQRVRAYYDHHRDELRGQAAALQEWLHAAGEHAGAGAPVAVTATSAALQRITARFDPAWGGTQGAPKFPRAAELEWLLDQPATDARRMAGTTAGHMASRGLQDHLGGGFFRYCVDAAWTIPHFEKMLYDNAQLLPVYARLARSADDAALRGSALAAATGIVDWLQRDLTAPDGAFYSAVSADSEGEEGRFYLWTREQLHAALPAAAGEIAALAFGLAEPPNFEGRAWHLLRTRPLAEVAGLLVQSPATVVAEFSQARRQLFAARERRAHPLRDDKILTAWNALAIAGLARSARLLGDARCSTMAQRALAALRSAAWIDGALYANAAAPEARIPGFLDDHAFLLNALLETLQLEFEPADLHWAMALAEALLETFEDRAAGGFWFSTAQHATPLARDRSWSDDATPNGNAAAILGLLRLGHLIGEQRYLDAATRALAAAGPALAQYPDACCSLLQALAEQAHPRRQIVVCCAPAETARWRAALPQPGAGTPTDAYIIANDAPLPGLLAERRARSTPAGTAYVCSGLTCLAPATDLAALATALHASA